MSDAAQNTDGLRVARARRVRDALLALVVLAGLASSAALSRGLASSRPAQLTERGDDSPYVSPEAARRMSLGFNGLAADWYWLRALQYVGGKVVAHEGELQLDDLSPLGLKQLAPLLDRATTLDPKFLAAYEYGAVVLSAFDHEAAVRLVEKGIRANPSEWRLRHHLGYIHWRRGEFAEAARVYEEGAGVAGAQPWMRMMSAQMQAQGGSRETAREIYARMMESDDETVRSLAASRIAQLDSLDERDAIRRVLAAFRERAGRCPQSWREVAQVLYAARVRLDRAGSPVDPTGVPYALEQQTCDVTLGRESRIPRR
ncbi:MAG TPA: hypothetical protein VER32_15620 [Pyrinomonadaceae bacterium]|nr:hypothetical protein [Pyrinomonadaceae bacterium]